MPDPNRDRWGVMAIPRPRRAPAAPAVRTPQRLAQEGLDFLRRHPARPQEERKFLADVDHRGLDADGNGATVKDHLDSPPQVRPHCLRVRRAGAPADVGARGRQGEARSIDQRGGYRMARHSQGGRREPSPRLHGDDVPGPQHQRQGSGPESAHQPPRPLVHADERLRLLHAREVEDQGVVRGAPLGPVNPLHRLRVQRVRPKPIDRLRRKGHQPSAPQHLRRTGQNLPAGVPGVQLDPQRLHPAVSAPLRRPFPVRPQTSR